MTSPTDLFSLAYIDPGSGAMLLQWIIAALIGGSIYFRRAIARILRPLLGRKEPAAPQPADEPAPAPTQSDSTAHADSAPSEQKSTDT